ncbi:MAG: DNA-directed RNA polymerase subunit alpha [Mesoaciditoga sp.]|uniref:DNA-directed RNA polymerase subunit alpha n=1 Tax=Athalassotoga sp. TaxID=2022597 RepID=UPI000CBBBA7B|nr:MAG: DNA-directed RNA polymerase subunit alpha [Mesoaciditoga sp.]PMP79883.1 MAG: DNA-directed RNA polymerase subunit alpha [Mesoaciditoga sp.]HEU23677.1 DNA-directed RNA polymerase subunit alpha [Mesoaciditoga lauensis]
MINYVKPERFTVEEEKEDGGYLYARYSIYPLERGYGVMIGNALRRILLSSIPSIAITRVKIKDVYHEYDAVKGVKEDVLQILLNVKQIQVKENIPVTEEPVVMTLQKKGAGILKAKDIKCPLEVKIANPDLKIATLNEDADFYMELFAEKGKGYLPVSEMEIGNDIQMLPVDGIFTPVVRVNFRTEDFRVGKKIDYDKLILEIWTKKSVEPTVALRDALNILIEHFEFLRANLPLDQKENPPVVEKKEEEKVKEESKSQNDDAMAIYDKMKIEDLELSVRALNSLKRGKIETVGELLRRDEKSLLKIKNFGTKSLEEINEKLGKLGLKLKAE